MYTTIAKLVVLWAIFQQQRLCVVYHLTFVRHPFRPVSVANVQGSIPTTISNLATLTQLNMSYNAGVVGVLPREVGSMTSLTVLHLYCAGIHGESGDGLSSIV